MTSTPWSLQRRILLAIAALVASLLALLSVVRVVAKRQLAVDYDAFVVRAAAWDYTVTPGALAVGSGAPADCSTWGAMMAAGAAEPSNGPDPFPPIAKLGTTPTPAQHDAIASAADRIAQLRATLRCGRRTREPSNEVESLDQAMRSAQGVHRQAAALAFDGAERLRAAHTNDPSRQPPEARAEAAEAAQELVDSLEIGLRLATDGLQRRRASGAALVSGIAPYLTAHVAEIPSTELREIVASEYATLIDDVQAEELQQLGLGKLALASSDEICAHDSAMECGFEARRAAEAHDLLAAVAASADRPFDRAECTNKALAIGGARSATQTLCSPLAVSADARASFEALRRAANAELGKAGVAMRANEPPAP